MNGSTFFIEKDLNQEPESKFSLRMRILIVAFVSVLYGGIAIVVGTDMQMSGTSLLGMSAIYAYGILGGLAILMLKRIFMRSEENRQILFDVLDRDPNAHAITDQSNAFLYINKAWRRLYGESEEVSYQDIANVFVRPYKLRQQLQVYFVKHAADTNAPDFIFVDKVVAEDKWLKLTIHPISGWSDHKQWFVHDVTYEYQAQQLSQDHYQVLKDVFAHVPVGLCAIDENGIVKEGNDLFVKLLDAKDLPEKLAFHDMFATDIDDKDCPAYALSTTQDNVYSGTHKIVTEDGTEKRVFMMQHILERKEQADLRSYAVFFDLDQIKHAPAASYSSGEEGSYFEGLFTGAPLGMCTVNASLDMTHHNEALSGLVSQDKLSGASLAECVAEENRETLEQWVEQVIENNSDAQKAIDVELLQEKGTLSARLYAHRMSATDILICFVDLTQQKNLEQQFSQSQKMQGIGQLAGGIAHDFNNLLTAMIGFCDLLLLRHKPGDPSFSDIMHIKQNANRASNLVRQLLAFSRQQTLQPKVLDITDVLSELSHLLQRLIGANIQMNMKHGQNLWPVKCDEGQLEQVLINLAVNARDAMEDAGKLEIITENYQNKKLENLNDDEYLPPGEWVLIKVRDNGTGIPPEVMERIFEPFFSTKEIGAGTGLGLSTVHGIVHQTGGFLGVESVVNKGTTFTIYLPHHKAGEKEAVEQVEEKKQKEAPAEDLTGSAAILLVEDEDAVRTFSSRALSNKGYKIVDAENGQAALEVMEKQNIELELLITDVIMPEMDGPTLAKHLRRLYPELKIIFMSGYSEDRFKEEFENNTHFIQKPFTLQQLAKKVKEVLDQE